MKARRTRAEVHYRTLAKERKRHTHMMRGAHFMARGMRAAMCAPARDWFALTPEDA